MRVDVGGGVRLFVDVDGAGWILEAALDDIAPFVRDFILESSQSQS